jgi:DNA-binding CsgD family transcriptional regulator
MIKVTMQQRRELAAEAQCSERTVLNWLRGGRMKPTVKERVDAAAKKLKIKNGSGK